MNLKCGRSKKDQKFDRRKHYDGLESAVDQKTMAEFRKPAYKSVSVSEYIARKYGKGSDADGYGMPEKVSEE